ncbi:MAG: hypothetical protein ACFFHD_14710 [Promethearchaeota archaeon]
MTNKLNFRLINEFEADVIISSLSNISQKFTQDLEELKLDLYISLDNISSKTKFPEIYLVSKYQFSLLTSLNNDKIVSAGLYFGFIKKGDFFLSLEGIEFLYKRNIFFDLKIINVTDKGEKSILYGNNILKNMIIKIPKNVNQRDILIVVNKFDEIIAIAQSKYHYPKIQKLRPKDIVAITLSDKGYYLRKNQ